MAVPFQVVFLADHPRPTRRQGSGGGPPPQDLRTAGQPRQVELAGDRVTPSLVAWLLVLEARRVGLDGTRHLCRWSQRESASGRYRAGVRPPGRTRLPRSRLQLIGISV